MKPTELLAAPSSRTTTEIRSTGAPNAPGAALIHDRDRLKVRRTRRKSERQHFKIATVSRWIINPDFDVDWGAG
jgi:hypothetical protein